jgi:manganese transport protein
MPRPAAAHTARVTPATAPHPADHDVLLDASVPAGTATGWRAWLRWLGPGFLVAVGYMDPGNWATDIAGGAHYGYALLSVILLSNLAAMFLQALAVRLGIVTGHDLASACRVAYPRPAVLGLWVAAELAIVACDLAEVVGTAIALQLLFGLPLVLGCLLTVGDVLLLLGMQRSGVRTLEAIVIALVALVASAFALEVWWSQPDAAALLAGFVPRATLVIDPEMLYLAIGIVGATVMPHNLYLHSAVVRTRAVDRSDDGAVRRAIRYATVESTAALTIAFCVNAAILVVAAAAFHTSGHTTVDAIEEAYTLLAPILGTSVAATAFAIALLAAGQNATVTGTLAGQIVMNGFLAVRAPPALRRLGTRALAVVPAVVAAAWYGDEGTVGLLVLSQVVLSLQLPFAVMPLVHLTRSRARMGTWATSWRTCAIGAAIAAILIGANAWMLLRLALGD